MEVAKDDARTHARTRRRHSSTAAQKIAAMEAKLERQDVRGTALRAAVAQLEEYARTSEGKAEEADRDLLGLDRELTILKSNVSLPPAPPPLSQHRLVGVLAGGPVPAARPHQLRLGPRRPCLRRRHLQILLLMIVRQLIRRLFIIVSTWKFASGADGVTVAAGRGAVDGRGQRPRVRAPAAGGGGRRHLQQPRRPGARALLSPAASLHAPSLVRPPDSPYISQ